MKNLKNIYVLVFIAPVFFSNFVLSQNTSTGTGSGTGGTDNSFYGAYSGRVSIGSNNCYFGFDAGYTDSSGHHNVFNGNASGYFNLSGYNNVFDGAAAGYTNTTGYGNTFVGHASGHDFTVGLKNTFVGDMSGEQGITGNYSTCIGAEAGRYFRGGQNTFIGYAAGQGSSTTPSNNTGTNNSTLGYHAGYGLTSGSSNIMIGYFSGNANTTGSSNSFIGYQAGITNITGSNNTCLGYQSDVTSSGLTNAMAIGYGTTVDSSNKICIGNTSIISFRGQVNYTTYSDSRVKTNIKNNVPGLSFIQLLKPVTYHYSIDKEKELIGRIDSHDWQGKYDVEKIAFTGFLAQDVDIAAQKVGYDFSGVDKSSKLLGLRYSEFVVPLVKAVQEQQEMIETQSKVIENLKEELALLKASPKTNGIGINLFQNSPNPFSENTTIQYYLPNTIKRGQIVIYDMSGNQVKSIDLEGRGNATVNISGGELRAGSYVYTLVADGQRTESKIMVLLNK